ncbi:Efflux pump aflT [Fusarium oxysporum f. sp. albedinis]|nr:Efflux pump aflT [Fusarium oxysporum f. sp. albedinis]KAK2485827.1 hypothetical protein H9L39_03807 [Fusarium oxysporum f. sp. albedinis]
MARVEIFLHLKTTPDGVCVCKLKRQQIWDAACSSSTAPEDYAVWILCPETASRRHTANRNTKVTSTKVHAVSNIHP